MNRRQLRTAPLAILTALALLVGPAASARVSTDRAEPRAPGGSETIVLPDGMRPGEVHVQYGANVYQPPEFQTMAQFYCARSDSNQTHLWTYQRVAKGGFSSGSTYLRCGAPGSTGWGYRHIRDSHSDEWGALATFLGGDWDDMMDWAVTQTLNAPRSATYRVSNDTWSYLGWMQIRDMYNNVLAEFDVVVVISNGSKNIITAYPANQ